MTEYIIRPLTAADAPAAAKLWHTVFGDEEALVMEFFRLFPNCPHFGFCAESKGEIAAAAYCPHGTDYITPDGTVHKGAYLYAVATHPDHRKKGLAHQLCTALRDTAFSAGMDYVFTKPSEESLYPWYEEKIGAAPLLGGKQLTFSATPGKTLPVSSLSPEAYLSLRNELLQGKAHVRHSAEWMTWQTLLHKAYGGGYYTVGEHIADLYCDGNTVQINELLPHPTEEQAEAVAQALMTALGAAECVCTIFGEGHYVSAVSADRSLPENAWFGVCYG